MVSAWINGETQHVDGAGLGAFNPLGTVPDVDRSNWGGAIVDRATLGSASTLETRVDVRHQNFSMTPEGTENYEVGHDITRGAYFDSRDRDALSFQAATVVTPGDLRPPW